MGSGPDPQSERDVLEHGHMAEQGIVLKHEPDPPLANLAVCRILALEQHAPAIGRLEPGDDAQQRRLAAAGWPEQRHELARAYLEAHVAQRREATEGLGDVADVDAHYCMLSCCPSQCVSI